MRQPEKLVVETPQPIEVPAGERSATVSVSMVGERNPSAELSECLISCTCLKRNDVGCRVVSRETNNRVDCLIEIPDNLPRGEEILCQFVVFGSGWFMQEPLRLAIV